MLWMASARYYKHKKNKKNIHRGQVITPFKKIKNMLGENLLCSILGNFCIAKKSRSKNIKAFLLA